MALIPTRQYNRRRRNIHPKEDRVIKAGFPVQSERRSADTVVEVVILIAHEPDYHTLNHPPTKKRIEYEFAAIGLPYYPPASDALVKSPGSHWDYQISKELRDTLRHEIRLHFNYHEKGIFDKRRILIYLLLSGAGTGKSRNAAELHSTAYKCFDGSYFEEKDEKIASQLQGPIVFHVNLEHDGLLYGENDPLRAIGIRMLFQLLRQYDQKSGHRMRHFQLSKDHPIYQNRAMFLIVDGLNEICEQCGVDSMRRTLTSLGNLQDRLGFMIVCCTSVVAGPTDDFAGSERRRIFLPCSPLQPPTVDDRPVFAVEDIVQKVLVSDCGGHGRELEMMVDVFEDYPASIGPNVKFMVTEKLK